MRNSAGAWVLAGGLLAAIVASCSAPDPGAVECLDPARCEGVSGPRPTSGGGADDTVTGGDDTSTVTPLPDGGTAPGTDGGVGGPVKTAFDAPYDPASPPKVEGANTAKSNHVGKAGAPGNPGRADVCLNCHVAGGAAAGAPFLFAGTIFTSGNQPAAGVDILVKDQAGKKLAIVKSDTDGNFWFDLPAGVTLSNASVDVRNATLENHMTGGLSSAAAGGSQGSCNKAACHSPADSTLLQIRNNPRK